MPGGAQAALGVDRPAVIQYLDWFTGFFRGDLGTSLFTGKSVGELISTRIEPTVSMILMGIFLAIVLGIPMGILAAWKANTWIDRVVMVFAVIGFAMPGFWLAFNLIWLFSVVLGWFPVFGSTQFSHGVPEFLRHLTLPAISIGTSLMALNAQDDALQRARGAQGRFYKNGSRQRTRGEGCAIQARFQSGFDADRDDRGSELCRSSHRRDPDRGRVRDTLVWAGCSWERSPTATSP